MMAMMCAACGEPEQGVPEMNEQERQTVEAYTETLAPVCMGRFQVEMPEQLALRSSSLTVNSAEISARRMSRTMFNQFIDKRQDELSSIDPIHKQDSPYLKNVIERNGGIVIIDHNESRHMPDAARMLEGYKFDGLTMLSVKLKAIDVDDDRYKEQWKFRTSNKADRLKQVEYLLRHLHPRKIGEMPEGPGLCFENGFLAGSAEERIPGAALKSREETVSMTFVDRDRRDVYINLHTDNTVAENDTLLDRTSAAEKALSDDTNFSVLRRGKVVLKGISQAEEWLVTETTDQRIKGHYFNLEANSKVGSPETPYIDISFRNGDFPHGEDRPAIDKASLTDAEAVGLWDAITRTFRPRPGAF